MADTDVIVMGAGLAGLACALALGERGLRVVVLEAAEVAGGRARSCTDDVTGDRVDLGPHILLSEYRNMRRLLEQLGMHGRIAWQGRKFITFVDRPRPVTFWMHRLPPPLHFMPSLLKIPQLSLRDVGSNARLLWRVMRLREADVLRLDGEDAETVLRRWGVSARFIDWYWRTVSMAIMNVPLERCSAGALLGFFRYMIGVGGYEVGLPAEGLGDLFAPAALRRITSSGSEVRTRARVGHLLVDEAGAHGVALSDGTRLHARWIVSALPPAQLQAVLPRELLSRHALFANLAKFEPSRYVSTYLWFDRKLTQERFWAKVWSPRTLNYDFYDLSNIRAQWSARGSVIASNIIHSDRAEALSDEEIIAASIGELGEYLPQVVQARLLHARVHRIAMAIPAPHPGSERLRPSAASPIDGLFLAGDWIRTGLPASMESAVRSGWIAAEQVLAAAGRPCEVALPLPRMQGFVRVVAGPEPAA